MERFNGGENKLYGGSKKINKDNIVDIKSNIKIDSNKDNNILLDSSIQRVMKKNRDLQKQLNQLVEENTNLKNNNSKLERQVTKLRNRN